MAQYKVKYADLKVSSDWTAGAMFALSQTILQSSSFYKAHYVNGCVNFYVSGVYIYWYDNSVYTKDKSTGKSWGQMLVYSKEKYM